MKQCDVRQFVTHGHEIFVSHCVLRKTWISNYRTFWTIYVKTMSGYFTVSLKPFVLPSTCPKCSDAYSFCLKEAREWNLVIHIKVLEVSIWKWGGFIACPEKIKPAGLVNEHAADMTQNLSRKFLDHYLGPLNNGLIWISFYYLLLICISS